MALVQQPSLAPRPSNQDSRGAGLARAFCTHVLTPEFFERYWEKLPLHMRAAEHRETLGQMADLVSLDDVVAIIKGAGHTLKIFRRGEPYDLDNPLVGYLDGASLIVNQADRQHEVLFEFSRTLAERHFFHSFCVLYLTPPGSQAVRLHNDDQDVFLMQVWGRKNWKIRNAPKLLAYTEEMLGKDTPVPEELIQEPILSFTMEPHDVLYIPRGYLHEADTGDEPSLHITVTIPTSDYCWGVQLMKSFQQAQRHTLTPELDKLSRSSMDKGFELASLSLEELDGKIQDVAKNWLANLKLDSVIDSFEQRMAAANLSQDRSFALNTERKAAPVVTEDSFVRLMYGISCRCEPDSDFAVFSRAMDRRSLEMKIGVSRAPLVKSLKQTPQRVSTLPGKDAFERLCVLEVLLKHEVVQVFQDSDEPQTGKEEST